MHCHPQTLLTEMCYTGFEPGTSSGRLKLFSFKYYIKDTDMFFFVCFFLSISVVQCRLLKFHAQSKQHYQGLLSWELLYQKLVRSLEKKKKKTITFQLLIVIDAKWILNPKRSLALQSQKLVSQILNMQSFAAHSSPHSEAWPFGVCCPKSDQITRTFRLGQNGSTTQRAEGSQGNSSSGTLAAPQSQSLQTEAKEWVLVGLQGPWSGR